MPARQAYGFNAGPIKDVLSKAQSLASSKEGAQLKSEAERLAMTATSALEHQDADAADELKHGAAAFLGKLQHLWDKNADKEAKEKAAMFLNKAKSTLEANGLEDLPTAAEDAGEQVKQMVSMAKGSLAEHGDLAELARAARQGQLESKASDLVKMALQKPYVQARGLPPQEAAAIQSQMMALGSRAAGFDQQAQAMQKPASRAEPTFGAVHV